MYSGLRSAFTAGYALQVTWIRILPGRSARNFTCKHARNASDISLSKVKSCRSIAKRGPPGRSAKFFINLHLAGSIYRRRLKIFLEVFALAPFPLPSFLHVKIKRAPAHSKNPLKLQNHDPRNEHIRQLSQLQPQAQILFGRSNHFRRRQLH